MTYTEMLQYQILSVTKCEVNVFEATVFGVAYFLKDEKFSTRDICYQMRVSPKRVITALRVLTVLDLIRKIDSVHNTITAIGHDVINKTVEALWPVEPEKVEKPKPEPETTPQPVEEHKKVRKKEKWTPRQKACTRLGFKVTGVPTEIIEQAADITDQIKAGKRYGQLKGKTLQRDKTIVSIPVGRRYRLLCSKSENGTVKPTKLMSHEDYNKAHKRKA